MLNDPLAQLMNGLTVNQITGKRKLEYSPVSSVIIKVLEIMKAHHYVKGYEQVENGRGNIVVVGLSGTLNKCGAIKPRFSVQRGGFEKFEKRYLPGNGVGILIVSTNQGIMTHDDAKEKKLGGVLIAYAY